jgi:hypothetical protein
MFYQASASSLQFKSKLKLHHTRNEGKNCVMYKASFLIVFASIFLAATMTFYRYTYSFKQRKIN